MMYGVCHRFYQDNKSDLEPIKMCKNGSLCKYFHWTSDEYKEYLDNKHNLKLQKLDCIHCNNNGTISLSFDKKITKIECYKCKGKGYKITSLFEHIKEKLNYKDKQRIWCKCPINHNTLYYRDNTHPRCSKHCHVCLTCRGITQVF